MESQLLTLSFILLVLVVATNLARLWHPYIFLSKISSLLLCLALLSLVGTLGFRIMGANRVPFANMYEFTIIFVCMVLLVALFIRTSHPSPLFDLAVALLLTVLLSIASSLPSELRPLMPALQSNWLHAHVATAVIAYACFALAFCLGFLYLLQANLPAADLMSIDEKIYKLVVLGFTLLTLVIITGAVWAEEVWGNWWSWDPKETWSLITWTVYAAYLHARRTREWEGRKSAWLVVTGFIVVLFTLFGVSILLPGLHSYV